MRAKLTTLAVTSLLLALSSCMTAPPESAPSGLAATQWTLIEVREPAGAPARDVSLNRYTLEFQPENRVAMKLDCNRGAGSWSAQAATPRSGTLRFGPIASTRALCPDNGQGARIAANLSGNWPYEIYDGRLTIRTANGTYTFASIA